MINGGNRFLSLAQMEPNAKYIWDFFQHWTESARAGMIGNMGGPKPGESTVNPQIWQSLKFGAEKLGYGIAQWTPATKYLNWAAGYGFDYKNDTKTPEEWLENECLRIQYEVENGLQWVKHSAYPYTFQQYITLNLSPENMAYIWLNNYEMPGNLNQPGRKTNARYWYDKFTGSDPDNPGYDPENPIPPADPSTPTPPTSQTQNKPSPVGALCGIVNVHRAMGMIL